MITRSELDSKLESTRSVTGLDLYITNVYKRSRLPYSLGITIDGISTPIYRGTKDDLYNWLDAYLIGYNTGKASNNKR